MGCGSYKQVLDKAERLRDLDFNVLPFFLRLQEFVKLNISVVLISDILWENFGSAAKYFQPIRIHFPQYTRDEAVEILSVNKPEKCSADFYENYVAFFLKALYPVCRNVTLLEQVVEANFHIYVEPVETGRLNEYEHVKLWKNFAPNVRKASATVFQPDASAKFQSKPLNIELPFYSKFLLIAAYLASYNPSRTDQRFFVKGRTKVTRTRKTTAKPDGHLLGPKMFVMDRLLAIFYCIVEEKVASSASIFNQIASLVSLKLLSQVGSKGTLDTPKYKCLVTLEQIRQISKTVGFDIVRYLYDFV